MKKILLSLNNINLTLEHNHILNDVNLEIHDDEIISLLGPSGCGKTSLLRIIAGLEDKASGEIFLNQKILQNKKEFLAPEKRKIGMVFQDYALFPHLNVSENIIFGLGHLNKLKQINKLEEMLELVKLTPWRNIYPHKLSGGQQQRVALARALAQNPSLLLLDEPFSNLDTELRCQLSDEVRAILKDLRLPAILVTHDQTEAFSFADKIGVMKSGRIEHFGNSYDIYHHPKTPFTASFIGEGLIVEGALLKTYMPQTGHPMGGQILVRPDDIGHDDTSPLKAKVFKKIFRGSHFLYILDFENGLRVLSLVPSHHDHNIGDLIGVRIEIEHIVEFQRA